MKRTTTLLAALASATLLLTACSATASEEPPTVDTTSSDQETGGGNGAGGGGDTPTAGEADQATQDYLDCLLDHGVDAIIDGEGNIALGAGEQGGISVGDDSTASSPDEAQEECQEAVPEFTAPNDDER